MGFRDYVADMGMPHVMLRSWPGGHQSGTGPWFERRRLQLACLWGVMPASRSRHGEHASDRGRARSAFDAQHHGRKD